MEILMGESLCDHFPLSWLFYFCKAEDVKPKGGAKHLVTNSTLFKDKQFRELVSKETKELKKGRTMDKKEQNHKDGWRVQEIPGAEQQKNPKHNYHQGTHGSSCN